ncbi:MAG: cyclophilin-like fold protein [Tepidisphaerales bacterium]
MPTPITIAVGTLQLSGQLNDSPTACALTDLLPLTVRMSRWGDEYYGSLSNPLDVSESEDAREAMEIGELAYWPPGNALCIFFGPTPASAGREPRAASPVNPVGIVAGDVAVLRPLGGSIELRIRRVQ